MTLFFLVESPEKSPIWLFRRIPAFGAGVMAPNAGILLNNHMGDFSGDSTKKNSVMSLHRPVSNMAATIVRKDGKPVLVIGSPGGPRIASTVAQVIVAVLDG